MSDLSDYKRKVSDPLEKHLRDRIRRLEAEVEAARAEGYQAARDDARARITSLRDAAINAWEVEEGESRIEWGVTASTLDDVLAVFDKLPQPEEQQQRSDGR